MDVKAIVVDVRLQAHDDDADGEPKATPDLCPEERSYREAAIRRLATLAVPGENSLEASRLQP